MPSSNVQQALAKAAERAARLAEIDGGRRECVEPKDREELNRDGKRERALQAAQEQAKKLILCLKFISYIVVYTYMHVYLYIYI